MFRIQEALGWTVVASDRKVIEEMLRLQDISFSANQANEEASYLLVIPPEIPDVDRSE